MARLALLLLLLTPAPAWASGVLVGLADCVNGADVVLLVDELHPPLQTWLGGAGDGPAGPMAPGEFRLAEPDELPGPDDRWIRLVYRYRVVEVLYGDGGLTGAELEVAAEVLVAFEELGIGGALFVDGPPVGEGRRLVFLFRRGDGRLAHSFQGCWAGAERRAEVEALLAVPRVETVVGAEVLAIRRPGRSIGALERPWLVSTVARLAGDLGDTVDWSGEPGRSVLGKVELRWQTDRRGCVEQAEVLGSAGLDPEVVEALETRSGPCGGRKAVGLELDVRLRLAPRVARFGRTSFRSARIAEEILSE